MPNGSWGSGHIAGFQVLCVCVQEERLLCDRELPELAIAPNATQLGAGQPCPKSYRIHPILIGLKL